MSVDAGAVVRAVAAVEDPEYPGVTIDELGILEAVRVDASTASVEVDLVPTRLGCPALDMIGRDVAAAARGVPGVGTAVVRWVHDPPWTPARVAPSARERLAATFTVTIRRPDGRVRCPVCGGTDVVDVSEVGPAPCRSIARCPSCRNPVEVLRT
jgi:ring-1,2-phenylacetyl-CoA epoxidase subunit PaaD